MEKSKINIMDNKHFLIIFEQILNLSNFGELALGVTENLSALATPLGVTENCSSKNTLRILLGRSPVLQRLTFQSLKKH